MTFSDPDIRHLLRTFFVCAWTNLEGDPAAGGSPRVEEGGGALPLPRGSGAANLQVLVYTPGARLIHAVTGAIGASGLRWELLQALATYEDVKKAGPHFAVAVVAHRQEKMQVSYQRHLKLPRVPVFGMEIGKRVRAAEGLREAAIRHEVHDRAILRKHPLARSRSVKTEWLTRDLTSRGFPGDGTILPIPAAATAGTRRAMPLGVTLPIPWTDLQPALRARVGTTLGKAPPHP